MLKRMTFLNVLLNDRSLSANTPKIYKNKNIFLSRKEKIKNFLKEA